MPRDFFDPTQNVVLIDAVTLREAERLVEACERCRPYEAEIPFDVILDHVTASDPSVTDYILESPAKCRTAVVRSSEKTLVEPSRWIPAAYTRQSHVMCTCQCSFSQSLALLSWHGFLHVLLGSLFLVLRNRSICVAL